MAEAPQLVRTKGRPSGFVPARAAGVAAKKEVGDAMTAASLASSSLLALRSVELEKRAATCTACTAPLIVVNLREPAVGDAVRGGSLRACSRSACPILIESMPAMVARALLRMSDASLVKPLCSLGPDSLGPRRPRHEATASRAIAM